MQWLQITIMEHTQCQNLNTNYIVKQADYLPVLLIIPSSCRASSQTYYGHAALTYDPYS